MNRIYEGNNITILKEIKNKMYINEDQYNKLRPVTSQPGVLYGLAKVHKKSIDDFPAFDQFFQPLGQPHLFNFQ